MKFLTKEQPLSHTTTEDKCGMDFSPLSGEATSGEKNFPMSHEWLATSDKWGILSILSSFFNSSMSSSNHFYIVIESL